MNLFTSDHVINKEITFHLSLTFVCVYAFWEISLFGTCYNLFRDFTWRKLLISDMSEVNKNIKTDF